MANSKIMEELINKVSSNTLRLVVGYGINSTTATNRSGSLRSYDNFFKTEQEARAYERGLQDVGYGDSIGSVVKVTLMEELLAIEEDETVEALAFAYWSERKMR